MIKLATNIHIMKKYLLCCIAAGSILSAQAQDVKKVKGLLEKNNMADAKTMIEQVLANPKSQKNVEAWYLKTKIYSTISADPAMRGQFPDTRMPAFESLKKMMELDSNQSKMLLTLDNFKPAYDLYTGGFQQGADLYNAEKYNDALTVFREVATVGEYIYGRGWGLFKLDTTITYYSALAAMNAKKEDEAIGYFKRLADANVSGGTEYSTPYRFLAKHYFDKKDEANMTKYVNAGLALYPKDDYMPLLLVDFYREKGDKPALYAKFDELLVQNPNNFDMSMEYANELFGETHVSELSKKPANYDANCAKIEMLYRKAGEIKPESVDPKLSLGKHFYNQMLLRDEEASKIKGAKPEDVKKRNDVNALSVAMADKAIVPLEEVFKYYDSMGKLKVGEKSNFKSSCSLLTYCYEKKKDKAKVDFYQKKYDDANTAHE
jgi:hypothetical protein